MNILSLLSVSSLLTVASAQQNSFNFDDFNLRRENNTEPGRVHDLEGNATISFKEADGGWMTAKSCDFPGNDISFQLGSSSSCRKACEANKECTHYSAYALLCWLKSGASGKASRPESIFQNNCGYSKERFTLDDSDAGTNPKPVPSSSAPSPLPSSGVPSPSSGAPSPLPSSGVPSASSAAPSPSSSTPSVSSTKPSASSATPSASSVKPSASSATPSASSAAPSASSAAPSPGSSAGGEIGDASSFGDSSDVGFGSSDFDFGSTDFGFDSFE
ncbi:hypothetical protein Poli38472_001251 [Pythium oligandrum]|uniref:Apple domain-containing protein n=1 Tax=Pythium oligandrum TaxID=41045 RepID=A0A8K1CUV0_PYTOL|nr:hypothetical protein Poli38472_001251 [Pythium oligandrum]|eukprot:TMW69095.1 hypothetical protein Poli38472_001251 [Pythium oligandrum]